MDVSIVIPTYNRANRLHQLLDSWRHVNATTQCDFELVFSDDGSSDNTLAVLNSVTDLPIVIVCNEHSGAGHARNSAVLRAKGRRIVFVGDDIYPQSQFVDVHHRLAQKFGADVAILGSVDWHPDVPVNHLMRHITEIGNEQFSYNRLVDNDFTDFRHFYTCNVSVDREFLLQESPIFDLRFKKYGYEDVELGFRLAKRGMRIYYASSAFGLHYHPYDVRGFCRRQQSAGEMAVVFQSIQPDAGDLVGVTEIVRDYEKYGRFHKLQRPLENPEWQDGVIERCEFYEQLLEHSDGEARRLLEYNLSNIYRRLFRAAYEQGVLDATFGELFDKRYVYERYMSWDGFWDLNLVTDRDLKSFGSIDRNYLIGLLDKHQLMTRSELQHLLVNKELELLKIRFRLEMLTRIMNRFGLRKAYHLARRTQRSIQSALLTLLKSRKKKVSESGGMA